MVTKYKFKASNIAYDLIVLLDKLRLVKFQGYQWYRIDSYAYRVKRRVEWLKTRYTAV